MENVSNNGQKLIDFVSKSFQDGKITNADLVQLIALSGSYLNLSTIPNYAKERGLSYNGVKNNREVITLFNVKFVVDNE